MNYTGPDVPAGFVPLPLSVGFIERVGPVFVEPEAQLLGFRVADHHCNPLGICHGGMMMTVMDMAIAMAIIKVSGAETFTPSVNLTYDFLRPAKRGEWLQSNVDFAHATRRTGFANGYLMGPAGPVMRANGICKLPRADDPEFGTGKWQQSGRD